jgi:site-specific recombinase XerD
VRLSRGDAAALNPLLAFLRERGEVPAEKKSSLPQTGAERHPHAYAQYLQDARGLARATIVSSVPFIRSFLTARCGHGPITLSQLRAHDVVHFVQRQVPQLPPKRAKILTCALRSFLQYVQSRGKAQLNLAAAVPVVANWSLSAIPRAIAAAQVRQLLDSIEQGTALGRRDYAIVLLLARLGVRAGEVVSRALDAIAWHAGQVNVRGKSGQRTELPLPVDVGQAIAAYLQRGRPHRPRRRVFLHAKAPLGGFRGSSGISSLVRQRLQRAGIAAPIHGAHQFRHG